MDMSTRLINYASIIIGVTLGAVVGWVIYQKTKARAKELEIEELEAARGELGAETGRRYSDVGDLDAAALMDDDDISLWDDESSTYRDVSDEDVFATGDEQAAIMGKKPQA